MGNSVFPTLKGITWELKKTPEFFNLIQKATYPGYETRISLGPDPLFHLELNYSVLRQYTYLAHDELKQLEGFFNARNGDFDSFLVQLSSLTQNPTDSIVVGQTLTADSAGNAPFIVSREGYNENIYAMSPTTPPIVYMGGVAMTLGTDYTIQGPGVATSSTTYPGLVAVITKTITGAITASFTWMYQVRFENSKQDFDLFLYLLWEAKQVQLVSTRT